MDKRINNNGYDYVDLGLPSGTKWATMNVGASKASDAGLYFQWGDTKGYTATQVGRGEGKKKFSSDWSDYKWGVNPNFTKYTTTGATLELEDDAAHIHMGGDWHMPTPDQIKELTANTTSTWTKQDGVNGRLFTSKTDTSKSIFIPAAGFAWDGSVHGSGVNGSVWSFLLSTDVVAGGQYLGFSSGGAYLLCSGSRCDGRSVRGVIDKNNDKSKDKKNNMNDNLNLIEILKDVPKGTKLYSPICGECKLVEIAGDIKCEALEDSCCWKFRSDGSFAIYKDAECLLFPSKENRDWFSFKVPCKYKHFEPLQKVLVKFHPYYSPNNIWEVDFYSHFDEYLKKHKVLTYGYCTDSDILPYEGNEDKLGEIVEK